MDTQEITLRLRCRSLPGTRFGERTAVRLGIQKGQEVVEDVPGDADEAIFTVPVGVIRNTQTGELDFKGPFVQGKRGERFIYLSWGEREGAAWNMFRRAKIHLSHLRWVVVEKALRTGQPVEALLEMTDARGEPACASFREEDSEWRPPS